MTWRSLLPAVEADGSVHEVVTQADGARLAEYLRHPQRQQPAVVVTIARGATVPFIDATAVAGELKGVAPVFLAQPAATFGLTDGLGDPRYSVFYGAGRIYPPGTDWLHDMHRAPLMFAHTRTQGASTGKRLVGETLSVAYAAGAVAAPVTAPGDRPAIAEVTKAINDVQVLVSTDAGTQALMQAVHLYPEVSAARLVRPRQRLSGTRRPLGLIDEFIPDVVADDPAERARVAYAQGVVTLARVADVDAALARVLLHPAVSVDLHADSASDDLRHLLTEGDVVAVEVAWVDGAWLVVLADEAEAQPSIAVIPDGPPWLIPADLVDGHTRTVDQPDDAARQGTEHTEPKSANSMPITATTPQALTAELAQALGMVEHLSSELEHATGLIGHLRAEVRTVKSDLRKARRSARLDHLPQVYADPEEQLRFEIWLSYLMRLPEGSRSDHPLPSDYVIGPDFMDSLESLEGISRAKMVDVLAETLCGVVSTLAGRELHQWRTGKSGPQEVRHDGARAWRVSLQVKSAGARRLKYWKLADGTIELDSVGVHDVGLR